MDLKCVIIDDEQPARDELAYLLLKNGGVEIAAQASSVSDAAAAVARHRPDVIFLDIQMPGRNGFDLVDHIRTLPDAPLIVFVTAYDNYAIKAFEANATDYLMKPFSAERLGRALERVKELVDLKQMSLAQDYPKPSEENTACSRKIPIENNGRILLMDLDDIVFCRYQGKKIVVHTVGRSYSIYGIQTMDQLEQRLAGNSFFRAHRSTIVNIDHIRELSPWFHGKYHITMKDDAGTEIDVTRDRVKLFKQHLGI